MPTLSANLLSCSLAGLNYRPVSVAFHPRPAAIFFSPTWNAPLGTFALLCNSGWKYPFSKLFVKLTFWDHLNGVDVINSWVPAQQQDGATGQKPDDFKPKKPNLLSSFLAVASPSLWICQGNNHSKSRRPLLEKLHYTLVPLNLMRYENPIY